MITLKNPFAKSTTTPGPSATTADDSVKGKQLLRGRTKARVESITAENEADRIAAEQVKHTLSEQLGNEQDTTETMSELAQIEGRIRAREAVLAIAVEKDCAAQVALTDATRQAAIAADDEANTAFKESVLELEALLFGAVKPAVDKVAKARLVVRDRSGGDISTGSAILDFDLWFKVYLHRSCAALIPGSDSYVPNIDKEGKRLPDWADAVSYNMRQRRRG